MSRKPPEDYQRLSLRLWVIKSLHCACYQRRDIRLSKFVASPPLFVAVSLILLVTLMKCDGCCPNKSGKNRICFAAPANETRFWREDDKSNCTHFFNCSFALCTCSALAAPEFFLVYFFFNLLHFSRNKVKRRRLKSTFGLPNSFCPNTHTFFAILRQSFLLLPLTSPLLNCRSSLSRSLFSLSPVDRCLYLCVLWLQ